MNSLEKKGEKRTKTVIKPKKKRIPGNLQKRSGYGKNVNCFQPQCKHMSMFKNKSNATIITCFAPNS